MHVFVCTPDVFILCVSTTSTTSTSTPSSEDNVLEILESQRGNRPTLVINVTRGEEFDFLMRTVDQPQPGDVRVKYNDEVRVSHYTFILMS